MTPPTADQPRKTRKWGQILSFPCIPSFPWLKLFPILTRHNNRGDNPSHMPDLFTLLPVELFRPLASPGAGVYADILLAVLAETQRHHEPLSRESVLNLIVTALTDQPDGLALTADADADASTGAVAMLAPTPSPVDGVSARSSAILRYLERCGWLRGETQSDFNQQFILPDYAFRLLRVLAEIVANEPTPLAGLIFTIHSVLQETLRDGNADFGIPEAHRNTDYLVNSLKELYHNIGLHINLVLQRASSRDVLDQFFGLYQSEIVDRAYHQLRTTDHVSRYRPGVLDAINRLSAPERLESAAHRQHERREAPSVEAAALHLSEQLTRVRDEFEQLDQQLQAIDARHNQFVHAAVRAIELHLAAHTTTSGQLDDILKRLAPSEDAGMLAQTERALQFFRLELADRESLAPPSRAGQPFTPDEDVYEPPDAAEVEAARDAVLQQLNRAIGPERVRRIAADLLKGRSDLRAADIPLNDPGHLPLLMYLRAYGDGSLGYRVEELGEWVQTGDYAFRDFRLHKVESKA